MKSFQSKQKESVWSKANRLPEGWSLESFSNVVEINSNNLFANTQDDYSFYYLSLSDVNSGVINHPAEKIIFKSAPERARRIVKQGDILLSTVRPNLQGFGYVDFNADDYVCSTGFAVLGPKNNVVGQYLYQFLYSHQVTQYFYSCMVGSNYPAINNGDIERISLPLPTIDEQIKISQILSTWDLAIEQVQRLIEAKQQQKKGLMQRLLTGKLRFPEFGETSDSGQLIFEGWEVKKLNQLFDQVDRALGKYIPKLILSISATIGFVDQKAKFGKVVAGNSLQRYNLLKNGEFAYNRGNSNSYPQGCIYMLTEYEEGAIPNVYYAFRTKSKKVFSKFYKYLFESGVLNDQLAQYISSSARGDGLFNITARDFFSVEIFVPLIEEQKKIAGVLDAIDDQIGLMKKYLKQLKQQKQGLLQKLLTGEIRVKVD